MSSSTVAAHGAPPHRKEILTAWACFVCWLTCAGLAQYVGVWYANGAAGILLGTVALIVDRERLLARTQFSRSRVVAGVAAGCCMTAATYILYPVIGRYVPEVIPQAATLYATLGQAEPWRAGLVLPLVITGEELVWRGAIQGALERRFGNIGAAVIGTLGYGAAVAPLGSPLLVAIALGCGLYWAALRAHYRSVTPALVSHLIWSAVVFLVAPLTRMGA